MFDNHICRLRAARLPLSLPVIFSEPMTLSIMRGRFSALSWQNARKSSLRAVETEASGPGLAMPLQQQQSTTPRHQNATVIVSGADWAAQLLWDGLDMRGASGLSSNAARGRL